MNSISEAIKELELEPDASPDEIKEAYRALVAVWHPDRFQSNPKLRQRAEEKLKLINAAYALLTSQNSTQPGPSGAESFEEYEKDELLIRALAFQHGDGVQQDHFQALQLFQRCAENGNPLAQCALAIFYYAGTDGIPKNTSLAATWARLAAEKGLPDAQRLLGVMYLEGDGIAANESEAVKWFRKAAELGDAIAQLNLGICLIEGHGIQKNEAEGITWLYSAAQQKIVDAYVTLALVFANGKLPETFTPPQKAQKFWGRFTEGYRQGSSSLQLNGKRNHLDLPMNLVNAHKWLTLAAMAGHAAAPEELINLEAWMSYDQIEQARCEFPHFLAEYGAP